MSTSASGNWSLNPLNNISKFKQHALSQLLFEECHKNCVDFDINAAQTPIEQTCIKNCQEKTYQSFDIFMRVQYNFSKKEDWRNVVDISNYTGMEVEHGLNTDNRHSMSSASNLGHFDHNSH